MGLQDTQLVRWIRHIEKRNKFYAFIASLLLHNDLFKLLLPL